METESPKLSRKERIGPLAWMAGNSVAANLLMLALLIGGAFMLTRVKQEVFPQFDIDIIQVTVPYPGANPQEIEQSILLAIEESLQDVDGLDTVSSTAREGFGQVVVELLLDANSMLALQDIQQAVDGITSFPENIETPQVSMLQNHMRGVSLAVYGDIPTTSLRAVAESVRSDLLQDPDIGLVNIQNEEALEIEISVPQNALRTYGLTMQDIANRIRSNALELSGGGVKTDGGEILLRLDERRNSRFDFSSIPIIAANDGSTITLGDIATINDGFTDTNRESFYDGKPAIILEIYRVGEQTPIEVADAVFATLEPLNASMPPDVSIKVLEDRSDIFRQRMELLTRNGYIGLALVLIFLALFLEARLAFWVMLGIPISFMGTFMLMPMMGLSINMVTMFAFLVALGIVVDDAIVVGENIYEHHQRGAPFPVAAVRGVRDVAMPVCFSILTNIVAFSPLFFVPGFMGKIFANIPAIVVIAFIISLVESLFVLPAHLSHQKEHPHRLFSAPHRLQRAFSDGFARLIRTVYGPILRTVLRNRFIAIAGGIMILTLTIGFVFSKRIGFTLFPRVESDVATATATLPYGVPMEQAQEIRDRLVTAAQAVIDKNGGNTVATGVFAEISNGGNVCYVRSYMADVDIRSMSTTDFTDYWREELGTVIGLESIRFEYDGGGPGRGAGITIELNHPNMTTLESAASSLASSLEEYAHVNDVNDGFEQGKRQFNFTLREQAHSLGLTSLTIAQQIRNAFYGAEALRQQRGRNEIRVQVRLPENERETAHDLLSFMVRTPSGTYVPLPELVHINSGHSYTVINRTNGKRTVQVTADVRPARETDRILEDLKAVVLPELIENHSGLRFSFEGRQAERAKSMGSLVSGFLMAMLGVYALLAVPFRSYIQPMIVMFSIPFGFIGAVIGHVFMGYNLSIISMMGMVALSGVVVNDSLVLIDYANRLRRTGMSAYDAIMEAGLRRFRPIMLTTLTTFCGLGPMIFETSRQARFIIPMALSLGFGILFATVIALILVPSFYLAIEDVRRILCLRDPHAPKADD